MAVTIKGFASDWSTPEPAKAGLGAALSGTFATLDAQGKQPVRKGELVVNAKDYGATGDGTTDDTVALQAFLDYVVANNKQGFIPPGNYRITAKLNIAARPNWSLRGAGRRVTTITQATANTPVLHLGATTHSYLHTYSIEDLTFDYAADQPSTNTVANCVRVSTETFQGSWNRVHFNRGYYGHSVDTGVGAPWGHTFNDITFGSLMTGGAFDWRVAVNGVPNNHFGRMFVDAQNMTNTLFHLRGYNFTIDVIEIIMAHQGPQLFSLAPGGKVDIGSLKLENGTYAASRRLIELGVNTYMRIGHMTVTGHTMLFTAGNSEIFYVNGGAKLDLGYLDLSPSSTTAGANVYALNGANGGTAIAEIGRVLYNQQGNTGTVRGLTNIEGNEMGVTTIVRDHLNGRMSNPKPDANAVIALGDPTKQLFSTAFTAPRTIDLPSENFKLFNGLTYEFIFRGAINGANTAAIRAGGTTLHTQSTDKAVVGFTYRRNISAASGWVLTKYETLP